MPIRACEHVPEVFSEALSRGCEECLARGDSWVHLRLCVHCGHVGCCDDSKNKHATKHNHRSGHPVIQSMEPGEDWLWCYAHKAQVG
jgi:hypothetical protein